MGNCCSSDQLVIQNGKVISVKTGAKQANSRGGTATVGTTLLDDLYSTPPFPQESSGSSASPHSRYAAQPLSILVTGAPHAGRSSFLKLLNLHFLTTEHQRNLCLKHEEARSQFTLIVRANLIRHMQTLLLLNSRSDTRLGHRNKEHAQLIREFRQFTNVGNGLLHAYAVNETLVTALTELWSDSAMQSTFTNRKSLIPALTQSSAAPTAAAAANGKSAAAKGTETTKSPTAAAGAGATTYLPDSCGFFFNKLSLLCRNNCTPSLIDVIFSHAPRQVGRTRMHIMCEKQRCCVLDRPEVEQQILAIVQPQLPTVKAAADSTLGNSAPNTGRRSLSANPPPSASTGAAMAPPAENHSAKSSPMLTARVSQIALKPIRESPTASPRNLNNSSSMTMPVPRANVPIPRLNSLLVAETTESKGRGSNSLSSSPRVSPMTSARKASTSQTAALTSTATGAAAHNASAGTPLSNSNQTLHQAQVNQQQAAMDALNSNFEPVNIIIFVADLTGYSTIVPNPCNPNAKPQSAIQLQMEAFATLINERLHIDTPVLLLLNKADQFLNDLALAPLQQQPGFTDFKPSSNSLSEEMLACEAANLIAKRFFAKNRNLYGRVVTVVPCACMIDDDSHGQTDTIKAVKDVIRQCTNNRQGQMQAKAEEAQETNAQKVPLKQARAN